MEFPLGSQELANECWRRQEEDPTFQEKLKGLTVKFLFVCLDCPGNEDRQLALDIDNGRFLEIIVTRKPAPSDLRTAPVDHTKYDFRGQGEEKTFIDLINGKIDLIQTLPLVKIEGDFSLVVTKAAGFMAFIDFLKTMDIEP
jgi:hypothetical protein